MSLASKPARPILGIALVLIGLWGGFYLASLLEPGAVRWWSFPYIVTVTSASVYTIYRGILLVNPSLKDL